MGSNILVQGLVVYHSCGMVGWLWMAWKLQAWSHSPCLRLEIWKNMLLHCLVVFQSKSRWKSEGKSKWTVERSSWSPKRRACDQLAHRQRDMNGARNLHETGSYVSEGLYPRFWWCPYSEFQTKRPMRQVYHPGSRPQWSPFLEPH